MSLVAGRNFTDYEFIETSVKRGDFELHLASEGRSFSKTTPAKRLACCGREQSDVQALQPRALRRATESMRRKAEDGVYPTRPALGYVNVRPKAADGQTRDRGGLLSSLSGAVGS